MRSLAPRDAQYRGRYVGGIVECDGTYHQGTSWAWLLGPFMTAYRKTHTSKQADAFVKELTTNWRAHQLDAGIGQVSEIFDGEARHEPGGCIAQAWSVAEWLRVLSE